MQRIAIPALTLACAMIAAPALAVPPAGATAGTAGATAGAAAGATTGAAVGAAAKRGMRACHDGKCTFTFTRPVKFRVAKRYRLAWVRVARHNADMVVVQAPGLTVLLGEGANGSFKAGPDRLSFRLLDITQRGAKIRFTG